MKNTHILIIGALLASPYLLFQHGAWLFLALVVMFTLWGTQSSRLVPGGARGQQVYRQQRQAFNPSAMSWQDLERLLAATYARKGWKVELTGTAGGGKGSDGGVDLLLRRRDGVMLVQAKHWKGRVGVKQVREMLGLLVHHGAKRGVIVGTGGFTKEAWEFVKGKPITLITGSRLKDMIDGTYDGA